MRPSSLPGADPNAPLRQYPSTGHSQLIEELPTGLVLANQEGLLVLANKHARRILEKPGSKLVGTAIAEVIAPLDHLHEISRAGDRRLAVQVRDASGAEITIGFQIARIQETQGEFWAIVFRDISQFVRVREERSRMVDLAARVLQGAPDPGQPAPFGLVDCLQLATMGRHSLSIEISKAGSIVGVVIVSSGMLWSVSDEEGEGSDALLRLIGRGDTVAACRALAGEPGVRNVERPWEELILGAARRADEEARRASTGKPDDDIDLDLGAAEAFEDGFGQVMELGLEAMLARDYAAAASAFERAQQIRPGNGTVQANLNRLKELGGSE